MGHDGRKVRKGVDETIAKTKEAQRIRKIIGSPTQKAFGMAQGKDGGYGHSGELEADVEKLLRVPKQHEGEGEDEGVERRRGTAKLLQDDENAEHHGGSDEGKGQACKQHESPKERQDYQGAKHAHPSAPSTQRAHKKDQKETAENAEMKPTESEHMGSANAAVEFAEGTVYAGAVAKGHGADEGEGLAFEVLGIKAYDSAAEGEHPLAKGEGGGGAEVAPIGGKAESLAGNALVAKVAGVIYFARISCVTWRAESSVENDEVANFDVGRNHC